MLSSGKAASSSLCQCRVAAALGELRLGLRDADLVQLKPGEQLLQQSSWVLLKGTLKTTGLASKVPDGMPGGASLTLPVKDETAILSLRSAVSCCTCALCQYRSAWKRRSWPGAQQ